MICNNFSIQNITRAGHLLTCINQVNSCFDPSCLSRDICRMKEWDMLFWVTLQTNRQSTGDYSHCILRSTVCWGGAFTYQTTALYCCSKNNLNIKSFALRCPFQTWPHYTQVQTIALLMFIQILLLHQMKPRIWLTSTLTHNTRKRGKFSLSITEKETVSKQLQLPLRSSV